MTPKERVLSCLNHKKPDRVPIDLGGTGTTSLLVDTYNNLKQYLGMKVETKLNSRTWQTVKVDEEILKYFEVDVRCITQKSPKGSEKELSKDCFVDEWGITRKKTGYYYEIVKYPLEKAQLRDLEGYPWPNPTDLQRVEGLREEAKGLRENTEFAITGKCSSSIFEQSWYMRGYGNFLVDLITNKEFAHALLRKITDIQKQRMDLFLDSVGEYLDVLCVGDDLSTHLGPAVSPNLYREMVKPYQRELYTFYKSKTDAKLWYHSCGNIYPLIEDLIDVGVDILNPIQVSAKDMGNTAKLKEKFGDRLCFWGAIDTQKVLPSQSEKDVRREVRKRIQDLSPRGGYVLAAVHNMCPDIPPENICAMFDEALRFTE